MDGVWGTLKRAVGAYEICRTNNDGTVGTTGVLWNRECWRRVCVAVIFGCTTTRVAPRPWTSGDRRCDCGIEDLPLTLTISICLLIEPPFFGFRKNGDYRLSDDGLTATRIPDDGRYGWILTSDSFCLPEGSGADLSLLRSDEIDIGAGKCGWGVSGHPSAVEFNPKQKPHWKKNATTRCYKRMDKKHGFIVGILGYTSEIDVTSFSFNGYFHSRPPECKYSVILRCSDGAILWNHSAVGDLFTPCPRNYPGKKETKDFTIEVDLVAGTLEAFVGNGSLSQPVTLPRVSPQGKQIFWYHACALCYANSPVTLVPTQEGLS
ncbi:hypothetical protein Pelo_18871 [Pelomyxa schiedti]|nr:hypothetical protein Pelo_18871 [Pelomyxa schiedti]